MLRSAPISSTDQSIELKWTVYLMADTVATGPPRYPQLSYNLHE